MKNKHTGFISLVIITIITILIITATGFYFYKNQKSLNINKPYEKINLVDNRPYEVNNKNESTDLSQILNLNSDKNKQDTCEQDGGKWINGDPQYGGQRCIKTYPDAGKKCTNSNQCLGNCVTNVISNLGKEGICQKTSEGDLCFNSVENKHFECLLGDIMLNCDDQRWDFQCDSLLKDKIFFK